MSTTNECFQKIMFKSIKETTVLPRKKKVDDFGQNLKTREKCYG